MPASQVNSVEVNSADIGKYIFAELNHWLADLRDETERMVTDGRLTQKQAEAALSFYEQQVAGINAVAASGGVAIVEANDGAKATTINVDQLLYPPPSIEEVLEAAMRNRQFPEFVGTIPVDGNSSFSVIHVDKL